MGSLKNSFPFRVLDKLRNHLLVSHKIFVSPPISRNDLDEYRGNLVVSPKLLIVGGSRALRRARIREGMLLGKKNVGVDSPFYFGIPFMLDSVTVIVDDAILLHRNHVIHAAMIA